MAGDDGPGPRSGAQAVERAVRVLRLFEGPDADLGVSEIAARADLRVSTAHRIVTALRQGQLLEQDQRTERYRLGAAAIVLGQRAARATGIERLVPHLEALAVRTGESVNLGVRSGNDVLVVHCIPSRQPLRFDQEPGSRVPLHSSAMGKALLAASADVEAEVRSLGRLSKLTRRTLTGRRLLDDLAQVRQRGWALNDEERNPGVRAIGVALRRPDGNPWAAIAVQGPVMRLGDARVRELADVARGVADELGRVGPVAIRY